MKVEVSEEGIVFCDEKTCINWIKCDTTCEECPVDKLFKTVGEYYAGQLNLKTS